VLHNWNLKLASFAFALVLYSFVHGGQDATRSIVVDLEANLPREDANRVLQGSIPRSVRITVRGSNQAIDQLHAGNVNITVDLQSGRETHVSFEPRMVHGLPPGARLEVQQFDPAGIDLSWEDRIVRSVPVQVAVVGTPAPGYVVKGAPVPEPSKVNVRGPLSEVSVLQFVRAAGFDVTGLSDGSYPRELALDGLSSRLRVEPRRVVVTTDITRELAERPFAKLPVAVVGLAKSKVLPAEVDVRLICPPEVLRGLRAEQVVPRVEVVSKEGQGSEVHPVIVSLGNCQAHVTPSTVVVRW
jgi:YbbR domain-containing protein